MLKEKQGGEEEVVWGGRKAGRLAVPRSSRPGMYSRRYSNTYRRSDGRADGRSAAPAALSATAAAVAALWGKGEGNRRSQREPLRTQSCPGVPGALITSAVSLWDEADARGQPCPRANYYNYYFLIIFPPLLFYFFFSRSFTF